MSSILGLVFDFDIRYFLSTFHNDYVWARNRSCIFEMFDCQLQHMAYCLSFASIWR